MNKELIPQNWIKAPLGKILFPNRPKHKPADFPDLPFIGLEHIEAHTMKCLGTIPAGTMKSNAVHFWPQDVLYGRLRPYLNKVFCPDFEGLCSAEFIVLPKSDCYSSRFIQYRLNASDFVSYSTHLNEGDRPRVDFDQIAKFQILLPPLTEQRRIVAEIEKQFSRLDTGVAALERVRDNLKRYRAAVLKAACEGRLVPQDPADEPASELLKRILKERSARWEAAQLAAMKAKGVKPKDDKWKSKYTEPAPPDTSNLPELPKSWTWATLESLFWHSQYGTSEKCDYEAKGVPVLRVPNIVHNHVDLSDLKFSKRKLDIDNSDALNPNDFLVIRTNGSRNLIGRAALVREPLDSLHYFASYLIRLRLVGCNEISKWISSIWDSSSIRQQIMKRAATTAGQYNINLSILNEIVIPMPPCAEQKRIVEGMEAAFSILQETQVVIEKNLLRADRLRQSILKQAFSGNLVPQDPGDEPAEKLLERIKSAQENPRTFIAPGKNKVVRRK